MLDGYVVVSLECSSKDLDAIEMYITLIDQRMGLVKLSSPLGAAISSVSERRRKNPTPPPRGQTEQSFYLIHNIFWEIIKMLLEDKNVSICGKIYPDKQTP